MRGIVKIQMALDTPKEETGSIAKIGPLPSASMARLFHEHAERWKNETGHLSSVIRMTAHPSYLRIIGLGQGGLPLILRELKERPDHWLVALNAITGEDPAPEGATFREAVAEWIKWGERRGFC